MPLIAKPKRRKLRHVSYYRKELAKPHTRNELLDLRSEAAHQPLSVLSAKDYEEIFWAVQARLNQKGE